MILVSPSPLHHAPGNVECEGCPSNSVPDTVEQFPIRGQYAAVMEVVVKVLFCMEEKGTNLDPTGSGMLPGFYVLAAHHDTAVRNFAQRKMINPCKNEGLVDCKTLKSQDLWGLIGCWVCSDHLEPASKLLFLAWAGNGVRLHMTDSFLSCCLKDVMAV